ncbi:MAG: O-antigen ligase family protein [Anaerolineales bacterium]|nr:O-antigen ligase family protein [Anaerolineales bacterium]
MPSKLTRFCEALLEAGWLGAIILVPLFFNVYSARVFEPDKLTLLRSIALVMIAAWAIKTLEGKEWESWPPIKEMWRIPMVAPVVILAAVYLTTTILSITPRVSFFGSYQRLQGTYTTLSYMVVFAFVLMYLRTKAQINRLVTTAIIVSVPISLYALIQKYGLDPLPWGGDVTTRVASNMGNAIFVSAYIIMITPLVLYRIVDSFKNILTDEELSWSDGIRASLYIFIAALHVLTLLFSQSRGPLIGFLAGVFTLILILLVQLRDNDPLKERIKIKELFYALFSLLAACLVGAVLGYGAALLATNRGWISLKVSGLSSEAYRTALLGAFGFVGALVGGGASIFILAATRKGWRWLWASWILMAALVAGFLIMFNLPDSPISDWRNLPYIGRIGRALDVESNTGKVRTYIWQGVVDMITPHEPIEFPDGESDSLNIIRPLIGYGPESMYVSYNRFYVPDLAHVEKRNASPDRSHNETFDALAITGFLGLASWQVLYGALFIFGFTWLGVIRNNKDRVLFLFLVLGSGIVSTAIFWQWLGVEFVGVAFPFGELAGLLAYLAYYALLSTPEDKPTELNYILLTAILAAVVAHFAEIHFGIAIAATRTYFFTFAAMAVVLGRGVYQESQEQEEAEVVEKPVRNPKRRRGRQIVSKKKPKSDNLVRSIVIGGVLMGLILGTMGYEYIGNPQQSENTFPGTAEILWHSLTRNPQEDNAPTYAALGLFVLTTLIGGILVVTETGKALDKENQNNILKNLLIYLGTAFLIGFLYMTFQAGRLRFLSMGAGASNSQTILERIRIASDAAAGLLTSYYMFAFLLLLLLAFLLILQKQGTKATSFMGWVYLILGAGITIYLINITNMDMIRADTIYKQAGPWDKRAMAEKSPDYWQLAISEYNHALELAPKEDFYYLWLGRAYLEQSSVMSDPVEQQQLMEVARDELLKAREINPLNTDHSANLARLHTRWAEIASSDVERTNKANQAKKYYSEAHSLSPQNAVILNEWAMLLAGLFGDCDASMTRLEQSLALDDKYAATYENIGKVALNCGDRESDEEIKLAYFTQAKEAYDKLLELDKCNLQAFTALGYAENQLGNLDLAIEANLNGLGCIANPTSANTMQFHQNLTILYSQQGDVESAVIHARSAAQAAGNNLTSLLNAGQLLVQLGAKEDAYQVAQKAGQLTPTNWDQLYELAAIFNNSGHPDEGIPFAQQALDNAPDEQKQAVQQLIQTLESQQ